MKAAMIKFIVIRLSLIPFLVREIVQKKRITIITYHSLKPRRALLHFKALKRRYHIISLSQYIAARKFNMVDKLPHKPLIVTIDDGFRTCFRLKDIIRECRIPVTMFLPSGLIDTNRHYWFAHAKGAKLQYLKTITDEERLEQLKRNGFEEKRTYARRQALSRNEIDKMRKVVDFQAHSKYHPILTKCTNVRVWDEIAGAKKELEDTFGLRIEAFAYPNGDYSRRELEITKEAGYACALTTRPGFNGVDADLLTLKRIGINDESDVSELIVRTSGIWDFLKQIHERMKNYARSFSIRPDETRRPQKHYRKSSN